MKIRSLALLLSLTFAFTALAEAKTKSKKVKPVYSANAAKARKANVKKYKATKRRIAKQKVTPVRHN